MTTEHTIDTPRSPHDDPVEVLRTAAHRVRCYAQQATLDPTHHGYQAWAQLLHPAIVGDLLAAWIDAETSAAEQIGASPQALAFARAITRENV